MTAPKRYNRILFTAAGALLLAAFGISLLIGAYPLTAQDILSALSGGEGMAVKVFWRLRLPRSLAAMVSGMALGVCGAVYQCHAFYITLCRSSSRCKGSLRRCRRTPSYRRGGGSEGR